MIRSRVIFVALVLWTTFWTGSALSNDSQFVELIRRTSIELGSDLEVELVGLGEEQTCAVEILYGDGQSASAVVGNKDRPASLRHQYEVPGKYQVSIVGKTRWRGLKTVSACDGSRKEIWVTYGARNAGTAKAGLDNNSKANPDQRPLVPPAALGAGPVRNEVPRRVALIVANSGYRSEPLVSPTKDADLLERVLRGKLGFSVSVLRDATRAQLLEAIESFEEKGRDADSALFYFTGHGAQDSSRRNYMIPVDASIRGEASLTGYGIEASLVVDAFRRAAPKVGLIVLDACRNLPTGYSMGRKSVVKGLARMDIGTATGGQHDGELLVAFAAEEGKTVEDPVTGFSAYAKAFVGQLEFAGRRPIRLMLDNVRDEVRLATNNDQRPVQFGEMRSTSYLVSPDRTIQGQELFADPDERLWREVETSRSPEAYAKYLNLSPRGRYADLAGTMIQGIESAKREQSFAKAKEAWNRADELNTREAIEKFLALYPQETDLSRLARSRIQELDAKLGKRLLEEQQQREREQVSQDQAQWKAAINTDTIDAYRTYMREMPQGLFVEAARRRIDSIEEQTRTRRFDRELESSREKAASREPTPDFEIVCGAAYAPRPYRSNPTTLEHWSCTDGSGYYNALPACRAGTPGWRLWEVRAGRLSQPKICPESSTTGGTFLN
jgi:hypothetical protein